MCEFEYQVYGLFIDILQSRGQGKGDRGGQQNNFFLFPFLSLSLSNNTKSVRIRYCYLLFYL
jgi:hypothetical protein